MKRLRLSAYSNGFTIIELLIATVVSSVLILTILVTFIQISRYFTRGITQASTQKVSRSVIESISQKIQTTTGGIVPPYQPSGSEYTLFCIGHSRYSYKKALVTDPGELDHEQHWKRALYLEDDLGSDVGQSEDKCTSGGDAHEFIEADVRGTTANDPDTGSGKNLLGDNMLIAAFDLRPVDTVSRRLYYVAVSVLNAPDDAKEAQIIDVTTGTCKGTGTAGGEFCGLSSLETNAYRLNRVKY